jgi:hypothetical protein
VTAVAFESYDEIESLFQREWSKIAREARHAQN